MTIFIVYSMKFYCSVISSSSNDLQSMPYASSVMYLTVQYTASCKPVVRSFMMEDFIKQFGKSSW